MKHLDLFGSFPKSRKYSKPLVNQREAFEILEKQKGSVLFEASTGSGKTLIGWTFLEACKNAGLGPLFYITPNKTLVDQVKKLHPNVMIMYGRNEYQCLFYKEEYVSAEDSPCSLLDCPHRVDQETGQTELSGVAEKGQTTSQGRENRFC